MIHSFCFGDDFNYFVCTNNVITLYNINLADHTPKVVDKIPIDLDNVKGCFFEPMSTTLVLLDGYGQANVFYLNLHADNKQKSNFKKVINHFSLDIAYREEELAGKLA